MLRAVGFKLLFFALFCMGLKYVFLPALTPALEGISDGLDEISEKGNVCESLGAIKDYDLKRANPFHALIGLSELACVYDFVLEEEKIQVHCHNFRRYDYVIQTGKTLEYCDYSGEYRVV